MPTYANLPDSMYSLEKKCYPSYIPIYIFRCRASDECPGFVINYERESCFRVDTNTDDLREDLIPATSRLNYFEKVCLKGNFFLF